MKIRVLYFALVRERVGAPAETLTVPDHAQLKDVQSMLAGRYPALAGILSACRFAVDLEYAEPEHPLREGAEVGVIPPVSGGSIGRPFCRIHREIIDVRQLADRVRSTSAGAIVIFEGAVRECGSGGRTVESMTYDGYEPMAVKVLETIAADRMAAHGVVIAAEHRLGCLRLGEVSLGIAVASAHRAEGLAALSEMIEQIKKELPVWKKEHFSDGTYAWIGEARCGDSAIPD